MSSRTREGASGERTTSWSEVVWSTRTELAWGTYHRPGVVGPEGLRGGLGARQLVAPHLCPRYERDALIGGLPEADLELELDLQRCSSGDQVAILDLPTL
jgi:hypothetical protein